MFLTTFSSRAKFLIIVWYLFCLCSILFQMFEVAAKTYCQRRKEEVTKCSISALSEREKIKKNLLSLSLPGPKSSRVLNSVLWGIWVNPSQITTSQCLAYCFLKDSEYSVSSESQTIKRNNLLISKDMVLALLYCLFANLHPHSNSSLKTILYKVEG